MSTQRAIGFILFGLIIGLFEATTATFLPQPWTYFHPVLPILICLIVLERPTEAVVLGLSGGLAIDLLSTDSVTYAVARFFLLALGAAFAARHLLTNYSLYAAVAMAALSRLFDWLWLGVLQSALFLFQAPVRLAEPWSVEWKIALWDAALVGTVFVFTAFIFKRFVAPRFSSGRR
jgi:hypothetical protein